MTRARTAALVTVGLVLVVGAPLVWQLSRPASSVGQVPGTTADADGSDAPSAADAPRTSPSDTGSPAPPATTAPRGAWDVARRDGTLPVANAEATRPVGLRIPALGVDIAVVAVGVEPNGEMEVPDDVRTAGWYRFGPIPGDAGSAVVSGHVDSRTQGLGAFHRLRELGVGEPVTVVLADGSERAFVTVARETYDKAEIPLADVFARTGPPRLALITCGGAFDPATRHYRDNVVVYAVPA